MIIKKLLHNWHIKVICLMLAMVIVFFTRLNSLDEEPVVVLLEVITNNNYTFTKSIPSKVTLMLRGERSEIEKISLDDIGAYIDVSNIEKEGIYTLPIEIDQSKLMGKADKVEITVNPVSITTTIEEKITKYLRIEPVISGIPSHGYEITSYYVNPALISVTGPKSHLVPIESIKTEPVIVTGKNGDFKQRIKLDRADTLLGFPEGDYVEFRGVVSETSAVKVIENVNIAIKELNKNLEVKGELPQLTVNVEGKLLALETFTKANISLTVNLKEYTEPGIYEVTVNHWTPRRFHIFNKSQDTVTIELVDKSIKDGDVKE